MLINHSREKLLNAIVYFAENTRFCGKVKLFKLLYFLDFSHFREIGRSVTELSYYAWRMGPVPIALYNQLKFGKPTFAGYFRVSKVSLSKGTMELIVPGSAFDPSHFSKREMRIMKALAITYRDSKADEMIEATHLENRPWHRVFAVERKVKQLIPYKYVLKQENKDLILELADEHKEMVENYR
jgi:uncharacterized phage-associated protein